MRSKFILITLLSTLFYLGGQAEKEKLTLILNSNSSIEVYKNNESSFLESYKGKTESINLASPKWSNLDKVKSHIYDVYPELIYCIGTKAYLVANKFAPERKIVYSSTINCHDLPQNKNAYGIASRLHPGMELMTLRMLFPSFKKIAMFYSRKHQDKWIDLVETEADRQKIKLTTFSCDSVWGVTQNKLKYLNSFDALWLTPDPGVFVNADKLKMVLDYCQKHKIPVISYSANLLTHPAVATSISGDSKTLGSQSAILVNRLIDGQEIAQHIFYPAGTEIKISPKNCKAMDLDVDEDTAEMVNAVIE